MSLINDALKKAQRQQTGGAEAPAPVESSSGGHAPRVERREKPADFRSQVLVLGGVSAGLLLALIVGAFFWWRSSNSSESVPTQQVAHVSAPTAPTAKPAQPEPKPEPAKPESAPASSTAATSSATNTSAPQFTLPLAPQTPAQPASTPAAPAVNNASQVAVQLPATTSAAEMPKPVAAPDRPKPTAPMVKLIDGFRVTGIRASGGESKVLMNDRVYRVGDTVDVEQGIKLTGVAQGALTFEDSRGAVYTRNF
ncbi:MAG TPA: hypothetical protein VFJ90_00535 [Candidatus Didemnitutus sp.]|nr:hypothetical protein [Candidatus Didemnitutus sp.]